LSYSFSFTDFLISNWKCSILL